MYKEENLRVKMKLNQNQARTSYLEFTAQQNNNTYKSFYALLERYKPDRILEIGTGLGGLTLFLKHVCDDINLKIEILSYDIRTRAPEKLLKENGIDFRIENIFGKGQGSCDQDVINFIQQDGKTLILCDGGSKIREFNLLSKFLKVGDIIMGHDYAPNKEYYDNHIHKKLWNWFEISDKDIQESVEINNLKPYMQDMFIDAVWVCKIKK